MSTLPRPHRPDLAHLPCLPPLGAALLVRALFKRPAPLADAPVAASYRLERIDIGHVRRYNRAFGFPGDAVTLTYLYLLAQRAQLATMVAHPIPFRIPGLIHVENRLAMHGPAVPDAPLVLETALRLLPVTASGALHCMLETRAFDGARLAFSCDSTYLVKRGGRSGHPGPPDAPPSGQPIGSWRVGPDCGRRYAALSGDWNPIHLWPWSARLMGMRAPIIHGAHTLARACALLGTHSGRDSAALWCRFRRPVPLGSEVALFLDTADGDDRFAAVSNGRVVIEGGYDVTAWPGPAAAATPAAG